MVCCSKQVEVFMECKGCDGKGKYVGLQQVEDPCERCGGTGKEPDEDEYEMGPDTEELFLYQVPDEWDF